MESLTTIPIIGICMSVNAKSSQLLKQIKIICATSTMVLMAANGKLA